MLNPVSRALATANPNAFKDSGADARASTNPFGVGALLKVFHTFKSPDNGFLFLRKETIYLAVSGRDSFG